MIDLEKLVFVLLGVGCVGMAFFAGTLLPGIVDEPTICPEPIPVVCMVKATHPATDGGEMLTVHCPPEEA